MGFFGASVGKESACNARALGSILGSGRSPEEENGYLHQYCLDNPWAESGGLQSQKFHGVKHD